MLFGKDYRKFGRNRSHRTNRTKRTNPSYFFIPMNSEPQILELPPL